ncbi:MAG: Crp/Fnr family transcriptional regulator [Gammaproteobacteria bacterium]|jgi:CRP/FNR family transcriptional regulator, anaerobic regulatory protein|nr:Crp/Fnr family transcriptional regulator [Gammaproteobacteria bacterium]MBU1846335.1 Crp/Fnr family transcriptional regulator [Gammaproteobacteria bacterium]
MTRYIGSPGQWRDWITRFPALDALPPAERKELLDNSSEVRLSAGETGYREGDACSNFILRIEGWSRIQRLSANGREVLLYRVGPGDSCVLTTSCLLGVARYPAASTAETDLREVAIAGTTFRTLLNQSEPFRQFVFEHYGRLLSDMITLLDALKFRRLDARLAELLLARTVDGLTLADTHSRIATDLGSTREPVGRILKQWARKDWITMARGRIEVIDRDALTELATDQT